MCPKIGPSRTPGVRSSDSCGCFARQPLLGKYHTCDRENEPVVPPRFGLAVDEGKQFLPERLNSITKDGVMESVRSLKENPDFKYSTDLIRNGSCGLKKYLLSNREMFGGADQYQDIISQLKKTMKDITSVGENFVEKLNQTTVGGAIEDFVDYYQTGSVPELNSPGLDRKIRRIQRDGKTYCALVGSTLGELTVGDILNMGYQIAGQKEFNRLSTKVAQTGGMMYKIVTLPIYDEASYSQQVMELFDTLKSTVNYITTVFKKRMSKNGVPSNVLGHVDQIQRGLNLCLQILQYEILVEKKKKLQY
jgi:hypothetical protein